MIFLNYFILFQGSGYVTSSLIIPLSFGIFNFLNSIKPSTEEGKVLSSGLIESVKTRLFPYETRTIAKISTLLDPRFKKEDFRNTENAESAAFLLEKEMSIIPTASVLTNNSVESNGEPLPSSNIENEKSLFSFLQERISKKSKSVTKDIIITKRQYLERPNLDQNADPLLFWKMMECELSRLEICALKYFCIPGSSVDSERMFSSAGQVVSERRTRLKPANINMLTFLHKNMNLL
ncbi:zinc finger BED domain-containing protein 1-like [Sitophilus oryzae]|uniref:Zinc finger BED domain-containing protein 1-like n=1 Tax=Sitophilus oryzae TaxID=7048 RepID=A0A6J2YC97_SITOR|nr:zinc finger BED domain-containing protein 1-like [Sitophilus oryzae]